MFADTIPDTTNRRKRGLGIERSRDAFKVCRPHGIGRIRSLTLMALIARDLKAQRRLGSRETPKGGRFSWAYLPPSSSVLPSREGRTK